MSAEDDFKFEPIPGLPEIPPEGEDILWQGRPDTWALAKGAFKVRVVFGYFALLFIWRVGVSSADFAFSEALIHGVPFVVLGVACCAVLWLLAWVQARATVYTLTTHRVVMRIGAALQMTLNLPYVWIENASLGAQKQGFGTIVLQLRGETRLSHIMTWPHVRPWRIIKTEPALRCIPEAAKVAKILADAAESRLADSDSIRVSAKRADNSASRDAGVQPLNTSSEAIPAE